MGSPGQNLRESRTPLPEAELVFEQAVEGLFKVALGPLMTVELHHALKASGLDLDRPLQPAHPRAQWSELVRIAAERSRGAPPPLR